MKTRRKTASNRKDDRSLPRRICRRYYANGRNPSIFYALSKGAVEIDYILALSIFLVLFALTVQYITDYFSTVRESATVATARSEAMELLGIADNSPEPAGWPQITNITNDLVLLMHFNNNTRDYSGKGNNGTSNGAVNCSASMPGRFYSGCDFNGTNNYIDYGNSKVFNTTSEVTIEAWVTRPSWAAPAANSYIVSKALSYELYLGTDGKLKSLTRYSGGTYYYTAATLATSFTPNQWYHVAGTKNATSIRIYVNGELQRQEDAVESISDSAYSLYISGSSFSPNSNWNGTIDEVAIWNRSLSAAEINGLYQQGLSLIGLRTNAFRFVVLVNNTKPNLANQSENATALNLVNELVRFNLSSFGFAGIDYNSVVIYNETNAQIPLQINGSNITFSVNVTANASRQFTVYFDDDSLFGDKSQNVVTDADNLTETFFPVEKFYAIQYEKLRQLNMSNYTNIKSTADTKSDFHVKLGDADTGATVMDYGGEVPRKGNIVALQRFALYQNSTAGVNNGKLTIQTW